MLVQSGPGSVRFRCGSGLLLLPVSSLHPHRVMWPPPSPMPLCPCLRSALQTEHTKCTLDKWAAREAMAIDIWTSVVAPLLELAAIVRLRAVSNNFR